MGITYRTDEGEGAFYGPKIDIHIEDCHQRRWQCGTIQVDSFQPKNFDVTYVAPSGQRERPVIIHSTIYGSLERFLGIVLEHYKGNLPFWLAPVQATVMTITDEQKPYAQQVYAQLRAAGIRTELTASSDPLNAQIKEAQQEKIPWMVIIGKREAAAGLVTLRHRDGTQEMGLTVDQLITKATTL